MKQRTLSIFWAAFGFLGVSVGYSAQVSSATGTQSMTGNVPKFAATGQDMGPVAASTVMEVTLWLNLHNRSDLDSLAQSVTDPTSPNFRHFLSSGQLQTRFAPTAAEAKTVQDFLTGHQLQIVRTGPLNLYVRARGTAANVSSAFHVQIDQFQIGGQTLRGNTSEPSIEGPAGVLIAAVHGLDNRQYTHPLRLQAQTFAKPSAPGTGTTVKANVSGSASAVTSPPDSSFFTTACFTAPATVSYTGTTISEGTATATYKGNTYVASGNQFGCGYTPAEIQKAYALDALYKEGYDGTGQTIVIIDWCGSPTITSDANAFSARFGLPALTSSNFKIINYPAPSTCAAPDAEINLDVEWAHAIAPGAKIILLVPPSALFTDTDEAAVYAAVEGLGSVISNSYGSEESETSPADLATQSLISEIAAVEGISNNYASGDYGDYTFDEGYPPSVSAPADSPYATAVGGISLALDSKGYMKFATGWGTNVNLLVLGGQGEVGDGIITDPPTVNNPYSENFFSGGSGGGPSAFFAKPSFQKNLPGSTRQLPDVSWLADPLTGAVIAISANPGIYPPLKYEVVGGTSLACPMFSALWAIANQEAGAPLGQAAPYLYASTLPSGVIFDVTPYGPVSTNVTGTITDIAGTTKYSAAALSAPLENTTAFYSAFWIVPLEQDQLDLLTFGTDSGLTVTKGWDNVTGVGVPTGKAFADYFKKF